MKRFFRVAKRVSLLTAHILFGLLITPFCLTRVSGNWRTNPYVTSWWHNRLADILGVSITISGYRPQPPALMVSNHVSWLDIIVLGALTPTDFLSKDEVRRWPVIGWLAARAGTMFIRRGDGQAGAISEQIAERLSAQGLLTLFPEGTTTDGSEVRPFFSRLFAAALSTRTIIVPVALRYHIDGELDPVAPYTGNQSLAENLSGLLSRERTQVHVAFAAPITIGDHSRKQVAEEARNAIVAALLAHAESPWLPEASAASAT